ncbi:DsbE family thiol:disulfide interchange protein [Altererythrobacter salegens]|uniref:DsbE family thiol:disulfide interchange protein n=1 Tax=Croceibacterium salegens TaxID=1737568 RepID=A0A6I4SWY7_9SPHN|nr:DsbE family thiol:disulfide interchange protein [Croceibacterium salegens]MXO59620.1 DsbE family thiol:disulfide interchange protein [Croceibacterium salegens]
MRWTLWGVVVLFAALMTLFAWQLSRPKDDFVESTMIGKPVPEFTLEAAAADRPGLSSVDLADGTPKLMNIFASWCVPCIAEAPQLAELERAGAPIVGVAIRDTPEDLVAFLQRNGNPFTRIGADNLSEIQFAIGSSGVPETFVIDGKGIIRYQHIGDIREEDIPVLLAKLKEAGA